MIGFIDDFLNGITMYRLMLYFLIFLFLVSLIFAYLNILPFNTFAIFFSAAFIIFTCWLTNTLFAKLFKAPTNLESVYITGLILTFLLTPANSLSDIVFLGFVAFLSQASKYILAYRAKHVFNPAAFSVWLAPFIFGLFAVPTAGVSWWVGTSALSPFVAIGGLLLVRKIKRLELAFSFFAVILLLSLMNSFSRGSNPFAAILGITLNSPILFLAFVMLTEPLTTPPKKSLQIIYGSLVGLFSFYYIAEAALLVGNFLSFVVSPKGRLILQLKSKIKIAPDIYDFIFGLREKFAFLPGQYLEWTLSHHSPDSRGTRRFFTVAASPTENNLRIGVKFYQQGSSFKKTLLTFKKGDQIAASCLAGEFILPKDPNNKLCFIAGGIGITPFRSMVKYLLDKNEARDIILLYASKKTEDFVYKDIFDEAFRKLKIKTIYVSSDKGRIDEKFLKREVEDYKDRIFYLSGPHSMVDAFVETLKDMGLTDAQIKVDFFPGYA